RRVKRIDAEGAECEKIRRFPRPGLCKVPCGSGACPYATSCGLAARSAAAARPEATGSASRGAAACDVLARARAGASVRPGPVVSGAPALDHGQLRPPRLTGRVPCIGRGWRIDQAGHRPGDAEAARKPADLAMR